LAAWRRRYRARLKLAENIKLVGAAERGMMNILFLADSSGIPEDRIDLEPMQGFSSVVTPDALTLLSTLVAVTEHNELRDRPGLIRPADARWQPREQTSNLEVRLT
jgi:alkanesulfonate monooxygenase SsuD/methylene tetrahydromethanopterin reductase-like flavin-dependent oxidoreductase (luciferase family)